MTLATQSPKPDSSVAATTTGPGESKHPSNHASNHAPHEKKRNEGTSLSWLLFNILLPLLILGVGGGVIRMLGTVEASARPGDDDSLAGRMRRLPPAEVTQVLSLKSLNKPLELRVDGVVVPYREVQIAAEIAGRIVKKSPKCEAGSFVSKGDLLVEIDDTDYQQDVERLTRMREQDYKALEEVDQELKNTKRLVEVAAQDVELQEREVRRLEAMPAGFASEGELDRAKKALLMSMQSRIGYDNQMSLLAARRNKLEATERLATTELRSAEINLERTKIYSPVDGVVVVENAELNSFIQRGSAIITVEDISKAEVAVNLRMDQLQWILDQRREEPSPSSDPLAEQPTASEVATQIGYSLPQTPAVIEYEIAGRSDKVYRWNGTLVRYSGIGLDARSRTVPVVIVVDQPRQFEDDERTVRESTSPSPLVRGMFVNVRLLIQPKTNLVAIPADSIQPGNRVWHFIKDESVLDKVVAKPNIADASQKAKKPSAVQASEKSDFSATDWVAGRVVIREQVVPVDSLWLAFDKHGAATLTSSDEVATTSPTNEELNERRYWVCEIPGEEIKGGDWIVRSPLGDFDSELAVRVPLSNFSGTTK